ncbi:MAG: signal peptidase I [Chloroflexota bacterium]|nr:signal peptidase I [Chloroflexota bacterium]
MDSTNLQISERAASPVTTTGATTVATSWPQALLRDLLETVLPALCIAIAIVVFVVQPTRVDGSSMEPTLHPEQRLVIEKVSYHFQAPARGDVVVLRVQGREDTSLIKRVVATAGDVIAIRNGHVFLNGDLLIEEYLGQSTPGDMPSMVVPDGYLFVLGDNRAASNDSRSFGMIPLDNIVGRAVVSYWPLNSLGWVR